MVSEHATPPQLRERAMSHKSRHANEPEILMASIGGPWSCPSCGTTNKRGKISCKDCGQRVRYSTELNRFVRELSGDAIGRLQPHDPSDCCGSKNARSVNPYQSAAATPEEVKTTSVQRRKEYNSLGGWLILPAIGLVLNPFLRVLGVVQTLAAMDRIPANMSGLQEIVGFECVGDVALAAWGVWAAILFFQRKASAPTAVIALMIGQILFSVILFLEILGDIESP